MHLEAYDPILKRKDDLKQGDLLEATPRLRETIEGEHPTFFETIGNVEYFIVLTQTCDLTNRGSGCKAERITIAPFFPLTRFISKRVSKWKTSRLRVSHNLCSDLYRSHLHDTLKDLFNNHLTDYFFVARNDEFGIKDNKVAYLNLWVSIKAAGSNYKFCRKARRASLTGVFRAKLGRLVGDIYSRVATPDWIDEIGKEPFQDKLSEIVDSACTWVKSSDLVLLEEQQGIYESENGEGEVMPVSEVEKLLLERSQEREARINALADVLITELSNVVAIEDSQRLDLRKRLLFCEELIRQI